MRAGSESLRRLSFPPGEDGLALVPRGTEVHRGVWRRRVEPDDLPGVVEDHHPALPSAGGWSHEEVTLCGRPRVQDVEAWRGGGGPGKENPQHPAPPGGPGRGA